MSEHLQALLAQLLALPEGERFELLGKLLDSFDSAEGVDAAWRALVRARLDELKSGKAELMDWADARKVIQGSRQ